MALLPYPDRSSADPRARAALERLPERNIFSMLANAPSVMGETLRLGEAILTRGELEPELRELAILHVAKLTDTEYEWVQHVPIARLVNVSEEQVAALERGESAGDAFDDRAELVLSLVEAVVREREPAQELVERAARELGPAKLVELLLVVGYYSMLGGVMRAVRLDVDEALDWETLATQMPPGS